MTRQEAVETLRRTKWIGDAEELEQVLLAIDVLSGPREIFDGEWIAIHRRRLGLSQIELAAKVGCGVTSIQRLEQQNFMGGYVRVKVIDYLIKQEKEEGGND